MKQLKMKGAVVLTAAMIASTALTACTSQDKAAPSGSGKAASAQEGAGAAEAVPVRYVIPGNLTPDHQKVQDAVNAKLKADGVNVRLDVKAIPWDAWNQKTNIMLSTGEEFELLAAMEDMKSVTQLAGSGALAPLNELIDKYGPNLKKAIPDYLWDAATVKGKIYAIPNKWIDFANGWYWVTGREDLMKKYNLKTPTTRAELIDAAEQLQKKVEQDTGEKYYIQLRAKDNLHAIYRDMEGFPFTTDLKQLFLVDKDGNAESYVESKLFKEESAFMRTLYQKGLISKDVLSIPQDQMLKGLEQGKFLFYLERGSNLDPLMQANNPNAKVSLFRLQPDKPTFRPLAFGNSNVVPVNTKHPEAGIQFLNWLYANQDNYDLFMYGIQGEQWTKTDNNRYDSKKTDKNQPKYLFQNWQIGNLDFARFSKEASDLQVKVEGTMDDKAVNSPVMGFVFDSNQVSTEYANVLAEIQASIVPIKNGVVEYDKYYPEALKKLKAAGLDKVMEEYKKQLAEWKAQHKK
ncbi:extracellular solute-binding protein [Paenibacillus thalictri]|uniref:Extracellular solute-binding protein n=1 Tax=Paenibacillus thalictri TaxID=2527873 RepID=A0A4V2J375_9BACL|nr:extracellular solute-binding protein [Paenibacillus thalictri]TBL70305.1 extracellular solute-binding protein [Paenibacillus thalictri]